MLYIDVSNAPESLILQLNTLGQLAMLGQLEKHYLVEISLPAAATPITQDSPQPRWATSKAVRITLTLPVQSKV